MGTGSCLVHSRPPLLPAPQTAESNPAANLSELAFRNARESSGGLSCHPPRGRQGKLICPRHGTAAHVSWRPQSFGGCSPAPAASSRLHRAERHELQRKADRRGRCRQGCPGRHARMGSQLGKACTCHPHRLPGVHGEHHGEIFACVPRGRHRECCGNPAVDCLDATRASGLARWRQP